MSRSGLIAVAVVLAGCGPTTIAQRLVGTWVGQPETAAQRAERSPQARFGGAPSAPAASASKAPLRTDLETVDVRVTLRFEPGGGLAMSVGDGREPLEGTWRLVSYNGDRAVVELVAKRDGDAEEKRRFEVKFVTATADNDDADGDAKQASGDAFTLREEGADRLFGALYFSRQE